MLLDELKSQTRRQHSELERINGMPGDRDEYVTLLRRFFGFIEPWEKRLAEAWPESDVLRAGREKVAWLRADLAHFGLGAGEIEELPRCEALPATASRAAWLGACYVLEGSTLGGQHITRHLHERLGVEPGAGDRYFNSYGSEVGARWRVFREELLRHSSPENDPEIIGAAQEMFARLAAWFEQREGAVA